jgi:hypothetical protein
METHPNHPRRSEAATATTQPLPKRAPKSDADDRDDDAALRVVADEAVRSVSALYRAMNDDLQRRTSESPYVALGIAAGIGFVVGGGLASPIGQALMRASFRAFGGTVLQSVLNASAQAGAEHHAASAK